MCGNNGCFGGNNMWWIIILLLLFGNCGGCGNWGGNCGCNNYEPTGSCGCGCGCN